MATLRSRGLSLAEVVIAIGVASLAVLTLAVFVSTIYRATHEGKSQAAASTVARRAIERLRADREYFRAILSGTGASDEEQLYWQADQVVPMRYHVVTTLEAVSGAPAGYYDASVTVSWLEEHRRREVVLETYLTHP